MSHYTDEAVLARAKQLHIQDADFNLEPWDELPAVVQVGFMQLAGEALANEPAPGQRLFESYEDALASMNDNVSTRSWGVLSTVTQKLWALTEARYAPATPAPETPADPEFEKLAELKELGRAVRVRRAHRRLEDVEDEVGVCASTLSRIERGYTCTPRTLNKVKAWLSA